MNEIHQSLFPWKNLLFWYIENGRHRLPWRDYTLSTESRLYRIWLSEILLQQTQVDRVIPYFERILERFPTIHDLAMASYDVFFPYYQGMGYYSRARNILKTATIVSEEYGGIFPREKNLLMKLPGVGGYTSSAILAFGYSEPYLAWDTNLEKVFARYYNGRKDMRLSEENKIEIEEDFRVFIEETGKKQLPKGGIQKNGGSGGETVGAKIKTVHGGAEQGGASFFPPEAFDTFGSKSIEVDSGKVHKSTIRSINNALMDFASMVDLKNPENIDWEKYPIRSGIWYTTRGSLEPREAKKSQSFPLPDATIIVILHKDHKVYYSLPLVISTEVRHERNGEILPEKRKDISTTLDMTEPIGYSPFILSPSLMRDTRKYVQDYFREKYGLELSVRPIHKKWLTGDGKPYVVVNVQIQAGVYTFSEYTKLEAKLMIDSL